MRVKPSRRGFRGNAPKKSFGFGEGAAAVVLTVEIVFYRQFAGTAVSVFLLEIGE